jgi:hypothetical protein
MEAVEVVKGGGGGASLVASASGPLRPLRAPFVVREATGCAIRTRLKELTARDVEVLREVGAHLGSPARRLTATRNCATR